MCEHWKSVGAISVNCPNCQMDKVVARFIDGRISEREAWRLLLAIKEAAHDKD